MPRLFYTVMPIIIVAWKAKKTGSKKGESINSRRIIAVERGHSILRPTGDLSLI